LAGAPDPSGGATNQLRARALLLADDVFPLRDEVLEERACLRPHPDLLDLAACHGDALDDGEHDPALVFNRGVREDRADLLVERGGPVEGREARVGGQRQFDQHGLELAALRAVLGFLDLLPGVAVDEPGLSRTEWRHPRSR
jgi:hypothetical protein